MKRQLLSLTLWAGLLAGCAENQLGLGAHHGIATGALYRSAEEKVLAADKAAAPDAASRKVVGTEVVTEPKVRATPYDTAYTHALPDANQVNSGAFPANRDVGGPTYSEFVERWTVLRGADRVNYKVTFRPGPNDRGDIQVVPEK